MCASRFTAKTPIVKRSVVVRGHKTSVSLEQIFWDGLKERAEDLGMGLYALLTQIDDHRAQPNLSCEIRMYIAIWWRDAWQRERAVKEIAEAA